MKTLSTICATLSLIAIVSTAALTSPAETGASHKEQHEAFGMGIKEQPANQASSAKPTLASITETPVTPASARPRSGHKTANKAIRSRVLSEGKTPRRSVHSRTANAVSVRGINRPHARVESPAPRKISHAAVPAAVLPAKIVEKAAVKHETPKPAKVDPNDKIAMLSSSETVGKNAPEETGVSAGMLASTIFKLGIVLGLVYLTILLLKKLSGKQIDAPTSSKNLRVLDTVRLSQSNTIHVVKVKGKTLLVGCSSGQVNLLQELETAEEPEEVQVAGGKFAEYLEKYSGKTRQASPATRVAGMLRDCTSYIQKRRNEIGNAGTGASNAS